MSKKKFNKRKVLQFIAMLMAGFISLALLSFVLPISPIGVALWPPIMALIFVIGINAGEKNSEKK